jgi:hypothetical protein
MASTALGRSWALVDSRMQIQKFRNSEMYKTCKFRSSEIYETRRTKIQKREIQKRKKFNNPGIQKLKIGKSKFRNSEVPKLLKFQI